MSLKGQDYRQIRRGTHIDNKVVVTLAAPLGEKENEEEDAGDFELAAKKSPQGTSSKANMTMLCYLWFKRR